MKLTHYLFRYLLDTMDNSPTSLSVLGIDMINNKPFYNYVSLRGQWNENMVTQVLSRSTLAEMGRLFGCVECSSTHSCPAGWENALQTVIILLQGKLSVHHFQWQSKFPDLYSERPLLQELLT